jgi:hypothetical protein
MDPMSGVMLQRFTVAGDELEPGKIAEQQGHTLTKL